MLRKASDQISEEVEKLYGTLVGFEALILAEHDEPQSKITKGTLIDA